MKFASFLALGCLTLLSAAARPVTASVTPPATGDVIAPSVLIGDWPLDKIPNGVSGASQIFNTLDRVRVSFGPTAGFTTGPGLFANVVVTTASNGTSFIADATNEPSFSTIVSMLTDGVTGQNMFMSIGDSHFGASGVLKPDTYWAESGPADFKGFQITRIELTINNVAFASPGRDFNHDGKWTDFTIDRHMLFYGVQVPEPTTLVASLIPLAIGCRRRRLAR